MLKQDDVLLLTLGFRQLPVAEQGKGGKIDPFDTNWATNQTHLKLSI